MATFCSPLQPLLKRLGKKDAAHYKAAAEALEAKCLALGVERGVLV